MTRNYSAALTFDLHAEAAAHLMRSDGQEDLCFAIWHPSEGSQRTTAILQHLILPQPGERDVHGNASFHPSYFERALGEAIEAQGGLAFLHSHLGPGWQDMSSDDVRAELGHAAAAKGATSLPLVGLTLGTDGAWSARFWEKVGSQKYERRWCENVRVIGDPFNVTYADRLRPPPRFKEELRRTISAWGKDAQAKLARLRVGIVGAGSVGTVVAEALARSGIAHITLIDFDTVENLNLDRLLHATVATAERHESKVRSLARGIRLSATADKFTAIEVDRSIAEEDGFRAALNCDIIFCCVDRPWGRAVLNLIAYAHLIPVIDGGIFVEVTPGKTLRRADWKIHTVMPGRRCMECLEQYNPGLVQAEREGILDDPQYIKGLPDDHPLKRNENVMAFSLNVGSFEVLQMLMMVTAPLGITDPGQQSYHFVPGIFDKPLFQICETTCLYPSLVALGDHAGFTVTSRHKIAEEQRARHWVPRESIWQRLKSFFARPQA